MTQEGTAEQHLHPGLPLKIGWQKASLWAKNKAPHWCVSWSSSCRGLSSMLLGTHRNSASATRTTRSANSGCTEFACKSAKKKGWNCPSCFKNMKQNKQPSSQLRRRPRRSQADQLQMIQKLCAVVSSLLHLQTTCRGALSRQICLMRWHWRRQLRWIWDCMWWSKNSVQHSWCFTVMRWQEKLTFSMQIMLLMVLGLVSLLIIRASLNNSLKQIFCCSLTSKQL